MCVKLISQKQSRSCLLKELRKNEQTNVNYCVQQDSFGEEVQRGNEVVNIFVSFNNYFVCIEEILAKLIRECCEK